MRRLRVLLIGEEAAGVQTLRMLSATPHTVVGVLASGKSAAALTTNLSRVAQTLGYRVWAAELVKDPEFAATIRSEAVDLILNVHSLYLINGAILQAPTMGSFNMHPGPLPRYAGLNSVCWAIYHGETSHGVTVHEMAPKVDAGRIAYQALFPIGAADNGFRVSAKCTQEGLQLLRRLLDAASCGADAIPRIQQDLSQRSYYGKAVPGRGWLSWHVPAQQVVNFIRACDFYPLPSPWGVPKTSIAGQELGISSAELTGESCHAEPGVVRHSSRGVEIAACGEWVRVRRILQNGRSVDPAGALKPGDHLESVQHMQKAA